MSRPCGMSVVMYHFGGMASSCRAHVYSLVALKTIYHKDESTHLLSKPIF